MQTPNTAWVTINIESFDLKNTTIIEYLHPKKLALLIKRSKDGAYK